ncbi:MAG: GNAT family N-acetyltransferase [Acidimicrobiia bacterium]
MSDTITTRVLEDHDVAGVLDLLRAALGEPPLLERTPRLFAWKHFDNPFGRSIAILAEAGDRIVGLRTFMRWDLTAVDGSTIRCVRAVDTATHPDFHRRGIFRRLTEEGLELAVAQGIDLVFNTPNEKSGVGYVTMGWKQVGRVGVMVRPSPRLLSGVAPEDGDDPSRFIEEPVPAWPLDITDRRPLGLRTPRSPAYLGWRFGSHPTARYFQVKGRDSVAVLRPNIRRRRRELLLVDVFGKRPGSAIRRSARRSRAGYMGAWFSSHTPERAAAVRAGLLPVPGLSPLTLMARPLRDLDVDVTKMESWDLAISDLELL